MSHKAHINVSPHQIRTVVKEQQRNNICQKWCELNVDSENFFKEFPLNSKSQNLSHVNNIPIYDFPTLYTTIPPDILKSKPFDNIDIYFFNKIGKRKY